MKCRDKESGLGKAKVDTAGSAYDSGPVEAWLPTEQQSSPAPCLASTARAGWVRGPPVSEVRPGRGATHSNIADITLEHHHHTLG